jgi:hypothetical protein
MKKEKVHGSYFVSLRDPEQCRKGFTCLESKTVSEP